MPTNAINIWSSPRNISTALMYSFAQRKDMTVVDEPLYAHYLRVTDVKHPGQEEILTSQSQFAQEVIEEVILADYDTPYSLHKQMTHHLMDLDWGFMLACKNMMIIRNPREIIASYAKVISQPTMQDVGIKKQMDVFQFLKENGQVPVIVDTNELLKNPREILERICDGLAISFDKNMLSWKAGARKEDGVWAKHWYGNVHRSTGFKKYAQKEVNLSADLEKLAEECMVFYEELFSLSVR